ERSLGAGGEMNSRGLYRSSMRVLMLDRLAAETLEEAAAAMYDALREAHSAEPAGDPVARTAQLQQLFDDRLHALGLRLTAERDGRMHPLIQGLGMPLDPQDLNQYLERARSEYRATIACRACSRVSKCSSFTHSTLRVPLTDSIGALSQQSPLPLIDTVIPRALSFFW